MKRATQSAARLLTEHPAIASYARAYNTAAPGAACVTLAAKSHDVRSSGRGDDWDAPRAAAAIDSQLWFSSPSRRARRFTGLAGHTAWVDCLLEVAPGRYASGARDRTIKLWAPWSGPSASQGTAAARASSVAAAAAVAPASPVRTLRGHGDSVSALLALPTTAAAAAAAAASDGGAGASTSSGGGSQPGAPAVLCSASLDRTIRVWSLAPLLGAGGSGGGAATAGGGASAQLAVLRGHGDAVRALMRHPSSPGCLVSGARDRRVKIWDLSDGRGGSCAATIRVAGPVSFLLPLHLPAAAAPCVAAVQAAGTQVIDPRCDKPVMAFGTPCGGGGGTGPAGGGGGGGVDYGGGGGAAGRAPILCAATHGAMLACGQRRTACVWDARMAGAASTGGASASAGASGSGGGGGGAARRGGGALFTVHQARGQPLTSLHLDRLKLVTATAAVQLHADASVFVWSALDGALMRSLSSTDSPVQLQQQREVHEALFHGGDDDAWELLEALDAGQLQAMMMGAHHPHNQQHAPHPDDAGDDDAGDAASVASSSSGSDAEGLGAAGEPAGADDEAGGGAGGEWAAGDDWEGPQDEAGLVSRAKAAGIMGRLEPGVLALAVDGPLITTVNTLGGTLVTDYGRASLAPRWWQLGSDCPALRASGGGGAGAQSDGSDSGDDDGSGIGGKFWSALTI